ncbi:MAG: phage major capsid protein [Patescibacteria group bacterium]|nr:phage major capsid protein [Patescibacteria group bacterium]
MITETLKTNLMAAYNAMQEITKAAGAEKRELTAAESEKFDRANSDYDRLKAEIRRFEAAEAAAAEQRQAVNAIPVTRESAPQNPEQRYKASLFNYLRSGQPDAELRANASIALSGITSFAVDEGTKVSFVEQLKYFGGIYNAPGVNILKTKSWLTVPILRFDDTANSGSVVAEGTSANVNLPGSPPAMAQVNLNAYVVASNVQTVSIQLLESIEDFDMGRVCGIEVGRKLANLLVNGSGTGQPTGILTSAGSSYTTTHYSSLGYADILGFYHSIDKAYRDQPSFAWVMNDSTLKAIRLITDSNGRPLYFSSLSGISGGNIVKETLFDKPIVVANDMPALGTASVNVIAAGAWSYLTIREVQTPIIMRLSERFAEYLAVGFLMANGYDSNLTATGAVKLCTTNATVS